MLGTDQAPVHETSQTNPQPPDATAGDIPGTLPEVDGEAGRGVDTEDKMVAYKALKKSYLNGDKPAETAPHEGVESPKLLTPPEADRLPPVKIRPIHQDDMDLLQAYKAEGAGKSLPQFILDRAGYKSPSQPEPEAAETALPDGSAVTQSFESSADVRKEIRRLINLKNDQLEAFNPASARVYEEQIENLRDLIPTFEVAEQRAHRVEQTAVELIWQEDLGRAQQLFRDAGILGTALETKAAEIRQQWQTEGHPLANDPRSAVAIYSEAAIALQISVTPASASAAPGKVSTPQPTSIHRPPVSLIAGGDARSQAPRPPEPVTKENYFEAKARYLGRPLQRR